MSVAAVFQIMKSSFLILNTWCINRTAEARLRNITAIAFNTFFIIVMVCLTFILPNQQYRLRTNEGREKVV